MSATGASGPGRIEDLETPCLVLDRDALTSNLARVRAIAQDAGVGLRPHVKTHKSLELARLQLEEGGACGLTASKAQEALVFLRGGAKSLTVAYPIVDHRKLDRIFAAAAGADVRFIADSLVHVAVLEAAAERAGRRAPVFMKVDVGLGRVGVSPTSAQALALARAIAASRWLQFAGLLAHAGHAYGASGRAEAAQIAEAERLTLLDLAGRLEEAGIPAREISVGSTPTVLAAERFDGLTEIRPGNYVFMDATMMRLGLARAEDVALKVLTTVVSRNEDWLIVDAGSKTLSSDSGAHGSGGAGFGIAMPTDADGPALRVARLSEEHGWVARAGADIPIGARLAIIPNHACPVANLVGAYWLVAEGRVLARWEAEARAALL
jgi:D-serine deaminase-like pyridoxal phosphate-dependent protein